MRVVGFSQKGKQELIDLVQTVMRSTDKATQIIALKQLWNFSERGEYQEILCSASIGLLSLITNILACSNDADILKHLTGILWYLSRNPECRKIIGSPEIGLLPSVMTILPVVSDYQDQIIAMLSNLSLENQVHDYLCTPEFQFFENLKKEMIRRPNYFQLYKTVTNFTKATRVDHVERLISAEIHIIMLEKLVSAKGVKVEDWEGGTNGVTSWCLSFANALSNFQVGIQAIRSFNQPTFFFGLMEIPRTQGIDAAIVVAKVYGRDESSTLTPALLVQHPHLCELLLDMVEISINYNNCIPLVNKYATWGFLYGIIKLRDLSRALAALSISDDNKKLMIQQSTRLLSCSLQILQDFLQEREEYQQVVTGAFQHLASAGGGGNDVDTAEAIIELLVQLSFYYDTNQELQTKFTFGPFNVREIFQTIVHHSKVSYEMRQYASTLLSRLTTPVQPITSKSSNAIIPASTKSEENGNNTVVDDASSFQPPSLQRSGSTWVVKKTTNLASTAPRHIMLSYSWAKNKALVVELGKRLREQGYDVWRDEEGSSLLPPMSGDIVEAMAEAIQYSYMVIIFVSQQYKQSANCRAEAKYARTRSQTHGLRLAYVMVDEKYTTVSAQAVDGWLGFMLGTELWYPLWKPEQLDATTRGLSDLIGENAKRPFNASISRSKSSMTHRSLSSGLSEISDHSEDDKSETDDQPLPNPPPVANSSHLDDGISTMTPFTPPPGSRIGNDTSIDYESAWNCLQPMKAKDPEALTTLLDELGVYSLFDFKGVEKEYYESIAILLKPAPQKNFRVAVGLL